MPAPPAAAPEPRAAGPFRVRVQSLEAIRHSRDIVARGRTDINRMVDVKAETMGRVEEVVAAEGRFVKRGDVLVRLDLRDRPERLAQAKALVAQRELEHKAAQRPALQGLPRRDQDGGGPRRCSNRPGPAWPRSRSLSTAR